MSLQEDLAAIRRQIEEVMSFEDKAVIERAIAELTGWNLEKQAVKTGDFAPEFRLPNHEDVLISFRDALKNGPAIVIFYRGGWCPYCNATLRAYQEIHHEIGAAGGQLIAVSPEKPDQSILTVLRNNLEFTVLSDVDNRAAESFRLIWEIPDQLGKLLKAQGTDLSQINGSGLWKLPLPATYVVNRHCRIVADQLDVDYRSRLEPREALRRLKMRALTGIG